MEYPSLRVRGHVSSINRTFIVEDYAEDNIGQWAKDEVTGEQGCIDDERSRDHVSGHGTTLSVPGSPDHSRAARRKEEKEREKGKGKGKREKGKKEKGKGKGKGRSKRTGRAFFGDE